MRVRAVIYVLLLAAAPTALGVFWFSGTKTTPTLSGSMSQLPLPPLLAHVVPASVFWTVAFVVGAAIVAGFVLQYIASATALAKMSVQGVKRDIGATRVVSGLISVEDDYNIDWLSERPLDEDTPLWR